MAHHEGWWLDCYEEAGLRAAREMITLDGPALLMCCECPAAAATE
jgi:hypothetical protein